MRVLLADLPDPFGVQTGVDVDDDGLAGLYAAPPGRWVRTNFATSIDGSITGADGRSGTVNSSADHIVFELLRALSDVVVVGAGTLRTEGYGPLTVDGRWAELRAGSGLAPSLPILAVTGSGQVPPKLMDAPSGTLLLATHAASPGLALAREHLGDNQVLVCGDDAVDVATMLDLLAGRGWERVLCEGGPHLLGAMMAADVVDEICHSTAPVAVGGGGPRMSAGPAVERRFLPWAVVEEDGTMMTRWGRDTVT